MKTSDSTNRQINPNNQNNNTVNQQDSDYKQDDTFQFDFKEMINSDIEKNEQYPTKDYQVFQVPNTPSQVTEQSKTADSMVEQHKAIDNHYQKEFGKEYSLLEQLTNRSMYKQVQANKQELFKASADYRIKFYKTVLNGRLEALQEKTNTGIMMIKAHYRQQVASFMLTKMYDLAKDVKDRQIQFMQLLMEKHDYVHQLKNYPILKDQYSNSIITEGERYMKFLDGLVLRFEQIIDEQISRFGDSK